MPKFSFFSKPEGLFQCTGFNYLPSGKNPYRSGINYLYRGIPLATVCIGDFDLEFEFEREEVVYHLYRCGIPLPLGSGINVPVSKKTPHIGGRPPATCSLPEGFADR
jgi:hypothetical protein